ncbi:MAG: DNA polymerase III subunit beta [Fimbriimonadales bacterium]
MIVDCNRKEFLEAVALAASPATSRATTLSLLKSLLLEAKDGRLRITGCDGEMWVERTIPTMVSTEGSIALDARLMLDILGSLPDGDVHLEQPSGSSNVMISIGQSDYRVVGMPPEDFPAVPTLSPEAELAMKASDFIGMVDSVQFAVAEDKQGRAALTGVLFDYDGDILRTVATDTHRLALRRAAYPGIGSTVTAIVPGRAINIIRKLPVAEDGELRLTFGGGRLGVEGDGVRLVTQLISGQFPPFERVIPSETTRKWMMDRHTFKDCLRRCSVLAKENSQRVVFKSDGDIVTLMARSEGVGEVKEEMSVVKEGDDVEIAFNGQYVLDSLDPIAGDGVVLQMTENDRAAVIKPSEDDVEYLCVVMPMALA